MSALSPAQQSHPALLLSSFKAPPRCGQVRDWVRDAQPGARLIYSVGYALKQWCPNDLRELVGSLNDKGFVTAHFTRVGAEGVYLIQRTSRPVKRGDDL